MEWGHTTRDDTQSASSRVAHLLLTASGDGTRRRGTARHGQIAAHCDHVLRGRFNSASRARDIRQKALDNADCADLTIVPTF
jgi:hypothetical protein